MENGKCCISGMENATQRSFGYSTNNFTQVELRINDINSF